MYNQLMTHENNPLEPNELAKPVKHYESAEQLPSKEEVEVVFETVLKGRSYKEIKLESDEAGITVYEVEIPLEDGGTLTINYQRTTNPNYKSAEILSAQSIASIHTVECDAEGMPCGADHIADYRDGEWIYR